MKKCGGLPTNEFEGWPPLRGKNDKRDLVYFAVKKEHDMGFKYNYRDIVLTYEEEVIKAIRNKTFDFEYHGHSYLLKMNEDGNYDIISSKQRIGEAMIENEECVVDILEDKKDYVRNTKSEYYDMLYKELFNKVRTKEYGTTSNKEEMDYSER